MSRGARVVGWIVVAALGGWSLFGREPRPVQGQGAPSRVARLWGPFAGLAARGQWVRVHDAMLADRPDLVWQRARTAMDLDPGATDGYLLLARHLFFDRASLQRETDPARREAWMRAGLAVGERGEEAARDPGALALWLGLARVRMAEDPELAGRLGTTARGELLSAAADAFDRAASRGDADARELGEHARALSSALDAGGVEPAASPRD